MKLEHITELDNQFRVRIPYYVDGKRKYLSKNHHFDKYGGKQQALKKAKIFRDITLFKIRNGNPNQDKKTLFEVIELLNSQIVRSAETKKKNNGLIQNHILSVCRGEMYFANIDSVMVQKSLNTAKKKSQDTIKRLYGLWVKLFKVAIKNKIVTEDLTKDVDIPRSKKVIKRREQYFDMTLFPKLLNELDGREFSNIVCTALKLMSVTGLRPSECLAIEKSSVNYEDHSISIHQSLGSNENTRNVIIPTKTEESVRTVYFPPSLDDDLKALPGRIYLFEKNGKPFTVPALDNFIRKHSKTEFRPYMLRHSVATRILENSDVRTLQEILGHSSPVMSQRYARSIDSKKRMAMSLLWDDVK